MQPNAAAVLPEEAPSAPPVRVLIVDDHPLFAEALTITLQADSRLQVAGHAHNGQEAIDLASVLRPDVVLMDLNMPVLDGFEATKGVREVSPETRVVVVTASASPGDSVKAIESGASAYLRKGCFAGELFKAIFAVASIKTARTAPRSAPPAPRRAKRLRGLAARAIRGRLAFQ
jgi:DNA-binding NarL/FixJ family response regulator